MANGTERKERPEKQPGTIRPVLVAVLAVALTALILRPGATAVGPVLAEIQADLNVGPAQMGILTALPGFAFALVGFFANKLTPRLGMTGALLFATSIMSIGLISRVLVDSWWMFLFFSLMALAGMAVGNVILPAFIKASFPRSTTAMSTIYTTFLAIGATLPTALAIPMLTYGESLLPDGRGWRFSVGFWVCIAVGATALWAILQKRSTAQQSRVKVATQPISPWSLFRSPTAIALAIFFGAQSMQAYIQMGWVAQIYRDAGISFGTASIMVSIISIGGIPGGLLMPRLVASGRWMKTSIILFGLFLIAGYAGIAFFPTVAPWLWATFLALSGFAFPTALALIISRTRNPQVTSAVSGFIQPVGYLMAGAGPMLVGWGFGVLGSWEPILLIMAGMSIVLVVTGLLATRNRIIDDEIGYSRTN